MELAVSGSSTITVWNRRSSALSFSKYFWYSSNVVAPMLRSSPRAKAGFKMLAASMAPSPLPAPTSVWISSIKRMMLPSDLVTSLITDFSRSSNSPLYLAPATSAPISREKSCLFFRFSGTSPRRIRCASPSTMAVLPVPGSPISTGLFLVRRLRIWSTRRISSSRPITGSSLPVRAASIKLMAYLLNDWYVSSLDCEVTFCPWRSSLMAVRRSFSFIPASFSMVLAVLFTFSSARSIASRDTYSSPNPFESSTDFCRTSFDVRLKYGSPPVTLGSEAICLSSTFAICGPFIPNF